MEDDREVDRFEELMRMLGTPPKIVDPKFRLKGELIQKCWQSMAPLKMDTIEKHSEIQVPNLIFENMQNNEYELIENREKDSWLYYGLFNTVAEYTGVGRRISLLTNEVQEGQFTRGQMLGYVRVFLPNGMAEVGTFRPQELKHEI